MPSRVRTVGVFPFAPGWNRRRSWVVPWVVSQWYPSWEVNDPSRRGVASIHPDASALYMKGTQVLLRETLSVLRGVSDKRTGGLVWKTLARRRLSPEQKENQKRRRERQQNNAQVLRQAAAAEPNGKD